MKRKKISAVVNGLKSVLFVAVLVVGLVLNGIPSLRPTVSENEKRELNRFPTFSWEALWNGDFFSKESDDPDQVGLSQWFSDTFPFREGLISAYAKIENLYGFRGTQIHGDIQTGDDIPDAPNASQATSSQAASSGFQEIVDPGKDTSSDSLPPPAAETMGGILLVGDTAYEYYNFSTSAANTYAGAVNRTAERLAGKANVYDIVVPTSIAITIPDSLKASISSSDQLKAINYLYGSMSDKVRTVDVYTTLYRHRQDYIFFRTDHHWTQLGAYYAYEQLMAAMNKDGIPLSRYTDGYLKTFDGFLGTFYASAKEPPAMAANPDRVVAMAPFNNHTLNVYKEDGVTPKYPNYPVIQDTTNYQASSKYASTFIAGDNPFSVIENHDLNDGSACVLVKESYGNCFAPLLIPHYQKVYVVDYRTYAKGLCELVEQTGATDVIFLNNISATRNSSLMSRLDALANR